MFEVVSLTWVAAWTLLHSRRWTRRRSMILKTKRASPKLVTTCPLLLYLLDRRMAFAAQLNMIS
jgi:hypothetical protein